MTAHALRRPCLHPLEICYEIIPTPLAHKPFFTSVSHRILSSTRDVLCVPKYPRRRQTPLFTVTPVAHVGHTGSVFHILPRKKGKSRTCEVCHECVVTEGQGNRRSGQKREPQDWLCGPNPASEYLCHQSYVQPQFLLFT